MPRWPHLVPVVLLAAALSTLACRSSIAPLARETSSPRQRYLQSLHAAGLGDRELTAAWSVAAARALASAPAVAAPYRESGYLDVVRPQAVALAIELRRGEELEAQLATTPPELPLFVELQDVAGAVVAVAEDGRVLRHRPRRDGRFQLLVQPELLAGGRYTLDLVVRGALLFPVAEEGRPRVISGYGDPRDGGRRSHQGIDIGAARGTPALAADDGRVTRVGENPLGGRVVHLDADSGLALYYAHLDRQQVRGGERVRRGDVVGRVGDTGNARGTTPHLHFEVRAGGAEVDPAPWIRRSPPVAAVTADLAPVGTWWRVARDGSRLRSGPSTDFPIVAELPLHYPVQVVAASRDWYRLELPGGLVGYTAAFLLAAPEPALRSLPLVAPLELRAGPSPVAPPIAEIAGGARVAILAQAGETLLVRAPAGQEGWAELP